MRNISLLVAIPVVNTLGRWVNIPCLGGYSYFMIEAVSYLLASIIIFINGPVQLKVISVMGMVLFVSSFFLIPNEHYFKYIALTWVITYVLIDFMLPLGVAGIIALSTTYLTLSNANDELNPNFDPVACDYSEIAFGLLIVIYAAVQILFYVKRNNGRVA